MPTSYTSLLGLALPVTGELSGTWGDTVNDYITQYVDAAAAGTQTISGSQTAVTLTVTNGSSLTQVGSGASGSAQYAVINCTGNPAGLLTITAPASSRQYLIINATSTSQSVKIVGAGPTTGVTLVTGESAIVAWNGSDYVKVASSTADGVTTFSAGTTGFTPSTTTSGAVTLAGTLAVANGGTGTSTTFTAGSVVFAGASGVYSQNNSNFFWDNSNNRLGLGVTAPTRLLHLDGGGSTTYLQMTNTASGRTSTDGFQIAQDAANVELILRENGVMTFFTNNTERARVDSSGNFLLGVTSSTGLSAGGDVALKNGASIRFRNAADSAYLSMINVDSSNNLNFGIGGVPTTITFGISGIGTVLVLTSAGFTQPLAYADTVSALGNTGTAKTIDLKTANVFTATLTGNCTFTLSNPIATGSSSFTLILTNDGTAGRTVAWSGGSFRFPGGAASLSRTTTANATDIWVFFTPDGGTTWYGNIAMKNMAA